MLVSVMDKKIELEGKVVEYTLKRNRRSKGVRLIIHRDGRLVATAPGRVSLRTIEDFFNHKSAWILEKLAIFSALPGGTTPENVRGEYREYKEQARALAHDRLRYFNAHYGFTYGRISVKAQKTLWGSCSRQGNLNFNYKIAIIPPALADYIVVHELCHLKELNHSPRFWSLVAETIPDYAVCRRELRKIGRIS